MTQESVEPDRRSGIPTRYRGVTFRSRLEARWAVMFDAWKWPWLYEPVDLEFYIPDFVLTFGAGDVAVEVKPVTTRSDLHGHAVRIVRAGWTKHALVLGACHFGNGIVGELAEPIGQGEFMYGAARIFQCLDCGEVSVLSDDGSYRCLVNGCYDGNAHVGVVGHDEVEAEWTKAGNRVQWRPE